MFSELVKNNYNEILLAAKKITRRRDYRQARELINQTYIYLHKIDLPKDNKGFISVFVDRMNIEYKGTKSSFNKVVSIKEASLTYDPGSEDWKQIEIDCEGLNEETKDKLTALSHLDKEDARGYVKLMEFKESLPPHERELFSLHFEQKMSSRQIAERMEKDTGWKMSYVRYNEMINNIKRKLHG